MIHITKIHKQRKSTTEPAVRRRPCSRRPTAAGVRPLRLATRCGSGSSGPSPRRSGRLLLPVWSSLGGLRLLAGPRLLLPVWTTAAGLHPSKAARPPACTRPRHPHRPAAAAARRPACAAACARAAAGRPPPASVRRLARPCPRRGGAHRRELGVGGGRAGGEEKFTGRRCRGKKKEIRDGERGAVKINKRMSIEVSP